MSVINRMLTDLERRGAPGAPRQHAADGAAREQSPRRTAYWLRRLGPPLLLVALVVVASALWREQWPRAVALVENTLDRPATDTAVADGKASPEPALPGVRRFVFERDGATTRLVVAFDRPLEAAPGYGRSGDRIGLQLPASWDRDELPTPPSDQPVFRSAAVETRGDEGTRIGLRVNPDARFDLASDGDRLTLTGRVPSTPADNDAANRSTAADSDAALGANASTEPAMEAVEATGVNGTDTSGATDTDQANGAMDGASTTNEAEPTEATTDATPTGSGDGPDSTNPGSDADGPGQAEAQAKETQGTVRKSEPDIGPQERARRLEARAREALDDGDVAAARTRLTEALEYAADRHSARDLLVGLALRSGDAVSARSLLAEGVARAPERGAYAKPFARLLVDAGDLERALRVLRRAAPAGDSDAGYHGLTAAVAQRLKRHELAASAYTRALEIDSSRGVWWMGLGISLRANDHPDEALAAFREARASGNLNERLERWVQKRIDALSGTGE